MAVPSRTRHFVAVMVLMTLVCSCDDDEAEKADAGTPEVALVSLEGIDTSQLTERELKLWSGYVSKLIAPCPDVAVPVAQCVKESRKCDQCLPAAKFLLAQARAGVSKELVAEAYANRFDPARIQKIDADDSPSVGPKDAAVTLVEWADFQCGGCKDFYLMSKPIKQKFAKDLRVVFKNYPWPFHPNAKVAAQAGLAAHKQGQFWRLHDLMFDNQEHLTETDLIRYAATAGLDVQQFTRDLHSAEVKGRVERDQEQGKEVGVELAGTPALFLNGRPCGKVSEAELEEWIQSEIDAAKKNPQPDPGVKPKPTAAPSASP